MNISNFFKNGKLITIPHKQKAKEELFKFLITRFNYGQNYSEKEVNEILMEIYDDYAILRRYLIDNGYLSRDLYGRIYVREKK